MRRSLLLLLPALLLPTSCFDDERSNLVGLAEPFNGYFLLRYDVSAPLSGDVGCQGRGTATVMRSGINVSGRYDLTVECQGPEGTVTEERSGSINAGTLLDETVSFDAAGCTFTGSLVDDEASGASGEALCSMQADVTLPLFGDWAITRGLAGISVSPDSVVVPVGDTHALSARLTKASGYGTGGWTVLWESSDPSIATVDESGRVEGVSAGTASIRAMTVPKYPLEDPVETSVPVRVGWKFASVEVGANHACGITTNGRVYCWGRGDSGQLGHGLEIDAQPTPVRVDGGEWDLRFRSVSPGYVHTCGIAEGYGGLCWGGNLHGELGDGSVQSSAVPVPVDSGILWIGPYANIVAGAHATCGTSGGSLFCWGSNACGQLGRGPVGGPDQLAPALVELPIRDPEFPWSVALSRTPTEGAGHACAWAASGMVIGIEYSGLRCWGQGVFGELGNGQLMDLGSPQLIPGELILFAVTAGAEHTCGLDLEGSAYCWGDASEGAVGTGSTEPGVQPGPVPVVGGHDFSVISAGDHFTCAVEEGSALCWGRGDSHQLGNGEAVNRLEPTLVAGNLDFASVSAGGGFACGLTGNGEIYCWGSNDYGQLATGDFEPRATPTRIVVEG